MRPALEVADIIHQHRDAYVRRYPKGRTPDQARVMDAIAQCRTMALGGHTESCGGCGNQRNAYNSCRNRHCPKCQNSARERWLKRRQQELLPVPYYHVVFTIPHCLADVALQNRKVVYGILFRAASMTLRKVGKTPRHLGAQMGALAVLHTWGQNLMHHPHLHCVVPAGGLDDAGRWTPCKSEKILLPVRVLSRLFRGIFLALLRRAHLLGELRFSGSLRDYAHFQGFCLCLREAKRTDWVVYCKRPFGGPETVLAYLGRYTHRVAISNHRLVRADGNGVSFRWKDYRSGQSDLVLQLDGVEFLRRFLMHTLPAGFVRIRSFGFLANRYRRSNLNKCLAQLTPPTPTAPQDPVVQADEPAAVHTPPACQVCQRRDWIVVAAIPRTHRSPNTS